MRIFLFNFILLAFSLSTFCSDDIHNDGEVRAERFHMIERLDNPLAEPFRQESIYEEAKRPRLVNHVVQGAPQGARRFLNFDLYVPVMENPVVPVVDHIENNNGEAE